MPACPTAPRMLPVTGPPRASTRQRAIATTAKAKMTPLRPPTSQSVTTSPKENKPASDTSLHVHRSKAARSGAPLACHRSWPVTAAGPDARPHYCALPLRPSRWLRVPGRGAHGSSGVGGAGGLGARGRALTRGLGPQRLRPLPCRLDSDRRPPARGTVASAARALGLASEPKGQI